MPKIISFDSKNGGIKCKISKDGNGQQLIKVVPPSDFIELIKKHIDETEL